MRNETAAYFALSAQADIRAEWARVLRPVRRARPLTLWERVSAFLFA